MMRKRNTHIYVKPVKKEMENDDENAYYSNIVTNVKLTIFFIEF